MTFVVIAIVVLLLVVFGVVLYNRLIRLRNKVEEAWAQIDVQLIEVPQPRSPYGIKGVGEIGLVPTAPAVAAALHDLDGQWRNVLPMRRGTDDAD